MTKIMSYTISLAIIFFGFFLILKSSLVAEMLSKFYSKYPIIRYANKDQLKGRKLFIIILGIVVLVMGFICLISLL